MKSVLIWERSEQLAGYYEFRVEGRFEFRITVNRTMVVEPAPPARERA